MNLYSVVGKNKVGNKIVWCIEDDTSGYRKAVKTLELKEMIQDHMVYNVAYQGGKIVEVPHALECLSLLYKKVLETKTVYVEYKFIKSSNRVYIKLYNSYNEDITELIYNVICRIFTKSQCSLTESKCISLDKGKRVHDLLPALNLCNSYYGLYYQEPLVDEKLYKYVA